MEIKIDVTDWEKEHIEEEVKITGEIDLVKLSTKLPASKVARLYLIDREKNLSPNDLLRPNKILLNVGAAMDVASLIVRQKKTMTMPNGKEMEIREYVGTMPEETSEVFVKAESAEGLKRAMDYLLEIVPGYIMGRLKLIAASGGNVEEAAAELKDKIDEMVRILS